MASISGQLIGLNINGAFVSCETACQFNFENDMLPSSAVDSGGWKEFVYGIRSWTMSVNGNLLLEAVSSDIKAIITTCLMQQLPVFLQFSTRPSSTIKLILSGTGLAATGSIAAPAKGNANWTVSFNGTGALQTTYVDLALLIDAMPAEADYPIVLDTTEGFTT